jgi:hypothetical protein
VAAFAVVVLGALVGPVIRDLAAPSVPTVISSESVATLPPAQSPYHPPSFVLSPGPALNGNPWGFNAICCHRIYQEPPTLCDYYFSCIDNFSNEDGYVAICRDGMLTHAGGINGACTYHRGVRGPLYSP